MSGGPFARNGGGASNRISMRFVTSPTSCCLSRSAIALPCLGPQVGLDPNFALYRVSKASTAAAWADVCRLAVCGASDDSSTDLGSGSVISLVRAGGWLVAGWWTAPSQLVDSTIAAGGFVRLLTKRPSLRTPCDIRFLPFPPADAEFR